MKMSIELKRAIMNAWPSLLWGLAFGAGTILILSEVYVIGTAVLVWGIIGEVATLILICRGNY